MTTIAQGQKDNKPAALAGFILLLVILAFFILRTFWDIPSSTVAAVKPIPEIKYQSMRLKDTVQMPWQYGNA